jgi:fido (protein-threonine AMPylation protein)
MPHAQQYIQELRDIHAEISGDGQFRHESVVCIDKFDREIHFTPHDQINERLAELMAVFAWELKAALTHRALAATLAKFYYGFIAIHPFKDANRRTAFVFLINRAEERGYHLFSISLLRKVLFEGNVRQEMEKLTALFTQMLKPA